MKVTTNFNTTTPDNQINHFPIIMRDKQSGCLYEFKTHEKAVAVFDKSGRYLPDGKSVGYHFNADENAYKSKRWEIFIGEIINKYDLDGIKFELVKQEAKKPEYVFPILMQNSTTKNIWIFYSRFCGAIIVNNNKSRMGISETLDIEVMDSWKVFKGFITLESGSENV